jgi:hypothetical protein
LHRPLITPPQLSGPNFGNDIPTWSFRYNTFLPFLGQMADRRAFELVVFLVNELPAGRAESPRELTAAGEGPRRAIDLKNVLIAACCIAARN